MSAFNRWAWPHSVMDIDDIPSTYARTIARHARSSGRGCGRGGRCLPGSAGKGGSRSALRSWASAASPTKPTCGHLAPSTCCRMALTNRLHRRCAAPARPRALALLASSTTLPIRWRPLVCPGMLAANKTRAARGTPAPGGSSSDGPLKPEGPDIDGLGMLEDPRDEIATWHAMIVPVLTGAGPGSSAGSFQPEVPGRRDPGWSLRAPRQTRRGSADRRFAG